MFSPSHRGLAQEQSNSGNQCACDGNAEDNDNVVGCICEREPLSGCLLGATQHSDQRCEQQNLEQMFLHVHVFPPLIPLDQDCPNCATIMMLVPIDLHTMGGSAILFIWSRRTCGDHSLCMVN